MEALVEVQRWLFSSLFCLALSLSFPPFLPFSSVLPELLSSQINSPPVFCSPSSVFCSSPKFCPPGSFLSFSKKIVPPQVSVLSPVFIGSRGRGTIPCPSAGHGGVGWLLCSRCRAWPSFHHGGGYGSPVSSLMRVWVV